MLKINLDRCADLSPSNNDLIEEAAISTWKSIENVLSEMYLCDNDSKAHIKANWSNLLPYGEEKFLKNIRYSNIDLGEMNNLLNFSMELGQYITAPSIELDVSLEGTLKNTKDEVDYYLNCQSIAELSLSYVFLALNLASPGCIDFTLAEVKSENYQTGPPTLIGLSAQNLRTSWSWSLKKGWPAIRKLDLEACWKWVQSLNLGFRQIANTNTEKALFAFLNACRYNESPPIQIIWLVHALEAIYDTPQAGIVKTLKNRLYLTLGNPTYNSKLNRIINDFYDTRSKFVHGESEISHPLKIHQLDTKMRNYKNDFAESVQLGFSTLIATFQKMITNNWTEICFKEEMQGFPKRK